MTDNMQAGNETPTGSLEKRGIAVETPIDENVLTENVAKAVRFRISKPQGYAYSEVDTFIYDIVVPSVKWYQNSLHQRDKTVHMLGAELDKAEVDILNLKNQLQYLEYNSSIGKGIQANQEDKEAAALFEKLQEAQLEAAALREELTVLQSNPNSVTETSVSSPQTEAQIDELNTYITQITEQYNQLHSTYETDVAALQAQLVEAQNVLPTPTIDPQMVEELQAKTAKIQQLEQQLVSTPPPPVVDANQIEELNAYIQKVTEQYNELHSRYETDVAALQAQLVEAQNVVAATPTVDPQMVEELQAKTAKIQQLEQQLTENQTNTTNSPEVEAHIEELNAYIKTITDQYNTLNNQYEQDVSALQNTVASLEQKVSSGAGVGSLKVELEAEKAKVARLEEALAEYETDEEETPERLPLLTEMKGQTSLTNTTIDFNNLPEGIRPEDL